MTALLDKDTIAARCAMLNATGRPHEALELLQDQAAHYREDPWLHLALCRQYSQTDDHRAAEASARDALALAPGAGAPLILLALALQNQGRSAEAQQALADLPAESVDDAAIQHLAAAIYLADGGRDQVVKAWERVQRALELDPQDPDNYELAVRAAVAINAFDLGRQYLQDGLALDPGHRGLILASALLPESRQSPDRTELVGSLLAVNPLDGQALADLRSQFFRRLVSVAFVPWLQVLGFGLLMRLLGEPAAAGGAAVLLAAVLLAVTVGRTLKHVRRFPSGYAADLFRRNRRAWAGSLAVVAAFGCATAGSLWTAADGGSGPGAYLLLLAVLPAAAAVHLLEGSEYGAVPRLKDPAFPEYRQWRLRTVIRSLWFLVCGAMLGGLWLVAAPADDSVLQGVLLSAAGGFVFLRGCYATALIAAPAVELAGAPLRVALKTAGQMILAVRSVLFFGVVMPFVLLAIGVSILVTGSGPLNWYREAEVPPVPDLLDNSPEMPDFTLPPLPKPTIVVPEGLQPSGNP